MKNPARSSQPGHNNVETTAPSPTMAPIARFHVFESLIGTNSQKIRMTNQIIPIATAAKRKRKPEYMQAP